MKDPIYEQMYLDTGEYEKADIPAKRDVYIYLVAFIFAVVLIALV